MELSAQAGPGVEKAAEQTVESACHLADLADLADLAGPDGWSTAAAEDVLDAIDTLTDTLGSVGEDLAQALPTVATATAQARRRLGITVDAQAPGRDSAASAPAARGLERRPPRRRGLGPGSLGGSVRVVEQCFDSSSEGSARVGVHENGQHRGGDRQDAGDRLVRLSSCKPVAHWRLTEGRSW